MNATIMNFSVIYPNNKEVLHLLMPKIRGRINRQFLSSTSIKLRKIKQEGTVMQRCSMILRNHP